MQSDSIFLRRVVRRWVIRTVMVAGVAGLGIVPTPGYAMAASSTSRDSLHVVDADPHFYDAYEPQECLAAIRRSIRMTRRRQDDTLRFTPPTALPPLAAHTAKACAAHLTVDGTDIRQIIPQIQVYLSAGDSARLDATVARALGSVHDDKSRAEMLAAIIGAYLDIDMIMPSRRVQAALAQLDSLHGEEATVVKATTYALAGLWSFLTRADDDSAGAAKLHIAKSWAQQLDSAGKAQARTMIDQAEGLYMLLSMLDTSTPTNPVPPVNGALIAGTPGTYPVRGKTTLLVLQSGTLRQSVAALRRIKAKFGDTLDIVFLGKTAGNFKMQGPLTFEEESKILAEYYTKELKVPGPVLLERTEITPRVDGKLIVKPTPNDKNFPDIGFAIVTADGKMLPALGWIAPVEIRLERALRRIIH